MNSIQFTIYYFTNIIIALLVVRAVMSWVVKDWSQQFPQLILKMTEPILAPMKMLFARFGLNRSGIDFSFIATFFAIQMISSFLIGLFGGY
ncbi:MULTISPECIES: YggT family protein [unclassified Fusibacter]|uniref:YggT family protein n=1 Tax=unclassified Fusibacter TaxID=2624464 RepID=UPI0013E945E3|nr:MULTISPECIES: YggT family protein [unclassified Fusibacter]MCK8058028.1 YggT family protein [Fusibacter sp. A2]NPE20610.1 YggT family protein [Fusibacter sp. A1]